MLGFLRQKTDSLFTKLILAIISIVFIFFFGSSALRSDQNVVVAKVNGEVVRDVTWKRRARDVVQAAQRYNRNMTEADKEAMVRGVLDQIIEERLILQAAEEAGFQVPDSAVRDSIMDHPWFQDDQGNFDKEAYDRYVERVGSLKIEKQSRDSLQMMAIQEFIRRSVVVTPEEVHQAYLDRAIKRDIDFVRVDTSTFAEAAEVSAEELEAFKNDRADEIKARYDRDFSRKYDTPKQVRAQHILMKFDADEDDAVKAEIRKRMQAVLAEAKGGADFGELARKWSEDGSATKGGDLGLFDDTRMVKPFSEAAFALGVGEVSDLVETRFGLHIIKVNEVQEAKTQALADVTDAIATELIKAEKAPEAARAYASKLVAVLKGELSGEEADALLAEHSVTVQSSGKFNAKDNRIPNLGADPAALKATFALAAEGDVTAEPVELGSGFAVIKLTHKIDADMSAFEDQKAEIQDDLLRRKGSEALTMWKADLKSRAKIHVSPGV